MNTHYTYFCILAAALAGPLALSFDKKVSFYSNCKYLLPAMIIPGVIYVGWDIYFTYKSIWSFNEKYTTGFKLANLPVEEVLFFLVVPYCCVFIYECIRCYFPHLKNNKNANTILKSMAVFLLLTGIISYDRSYTSWTFILCALFIGIIYRYKLFFKDFDAGFFLASFTVTLLPFLVVNFFLTHIPVISYDDGENLGIRVLTIPIEDSLYGMLLIMMNIAFFEKLRNRRATRRIGAVGTGGYK